MDRNLPGARIILDARATLLWHNAEHVGRTFV
jgi:hypothetical protein